MKKVISITMAAAQAAENYGDKWDFTWLGIYIYIYIYITHHTSIRTWTHLQNSLTAAETPTLKISSPGTSLKW